MIYPTQATKQVKLLFRSLRIFTFNGSFKGGSLSILIVFGGMKSTSKFPTLTSKAVVGCFLPFSKICFSGLHGALWRLLILRFLEIEAVDCEILFAKTSLKIDNFFLSFSTLFSVFS